MANIGYLNGFLSTLGTAVEFRSVNFQQVNNSSITTTVSGRTVRTSNSTTLWAGQLEFTTYTQAAFKSIQAFFARTRGTLNDFYVIIPGVSTFTGSATFSPTIEIVGNVSAGNNTVEIRSSEGSKNLKAGDVIQFESHNKVYMITEDVTAIGSDSGDSAGGKTLQFEPNLISGVSANQFVNYTEVPFLVISTSDSYEMRYNVDGTVQFTIDVREVI